MAKLIWDEVAQRSYESGIEHGVLYRDNQPGVVWNGLVSINEKFSGEGATRYYFDGVQYLLMPNPTEFSLGIKAFQYPQEFNECDGSSVVSQGVFVNQQPNKSFGLSYITILGNDIDNLNHGYKIHLIYNALVQPSDKTYATVQTDADIMTFSWDVITTPILVSGYKPTAHLIFDSNKADAYTLNLLENILYGNVNAPRLPLPDEILSMPWDQRFIIVVPTPDVQYLPANAKDGDLVFAISDEKVYSVSTPATLKSRSVFVISGNNPNLLPINAYPGDIAYDQSSGTLYTIGE